jgi:hypothetical protein
MEVMAGLNVLGIIPIFCHPDWRGSGLSRTATDLLMVLAKRGNRVRVVSPLFDMDHVFTMPEQKVYFDGNLELVYNTQAHSSRLRPRRGSWLWLGRIATE